MNKASGGDGIPVERFQILKEENSLDQSLEVKECHLQQNFSHGKFHAKMGTTKDRNGMDLTEAENIKKRWQEYTQNCTKKSFMTKIIMMVQSLT